MKRKSKILLTLLLIFSMVFVLTACGSSDDDVDEVTGDVTEDATEDETEDEGTDDITEDATYNDGTYTGEGERREHGYEAAEVTVENGEISDIVLMRMTADEEEVDYDEWVGENDMPNLKQFKEDLAQDMLDQQTYEVDAIATATQTSEGWMDAVQDALEKAQ